MNANLLLTADVSQYNKDLDAAIAKTSEAGSKMGDAAQKAAGATNTLTQNYRSAFKESQRIAQQFGTTSAEAIAAAKAAGQYKNQLDDVAQVTKALASDTPVFSATLGVMQGLAGAAATATGAMGLLGVKSAEVSGMLLKVNSAIALVQGLQALGTLSDSFMALSVVIKTQVVPSLVTLKGALMATGIIAIAAAVAVLAYNWYETSKAEDAATKAAADYKATLQAVIEARKNNFDAQTGMYDLYLKTLKDGREKELGQALSDYNKERINYNHLVQTKKLTYEQGQQAQTYLLEIWANKRAEIEKKYEAKSITGNFSGSEIKSRQGTKIDLMGRLAESVQSANAPAQLQKVLGYVQSTAQKQIMTVSMELNSFMESAFSGIGDAIGQGIAAAMEGSDPFAALGSVLLSSLGSLMQTLGGAFIAAGVAQEAFTANFAVGNAFGAIAAGVALVAAGSAIKAATRNLSSLKTNGGSSGTNYNSGASGYSQPSGNNSMYGFNGMFYSGISKGGKLEAEVRGKDLYFVYKTSQAERKRL